MSPPHFRQRMRAALESFSSAGSRWKRAPQSPHVTIIDDNACSSGNGRPVALISWPVEKAGTCRNGYNLKYSTT
jgi:phage-related baseplate assembly protein